VIVALFDHKYKEKAA